MKIRAPRVFRRFTYANVMSTLAVFLFISGGAAYAANTVFSADIVDGEVKSVDIGNSQVSSADVRNDNLAAADLAPNAVGNSELATDSVTTGKVANGTVSADDLGVNSVGFSELNFGTLPQFTYQKQTSSATDTTTVKEISVACDSGSEVTGGGFVVAAGAGGGNVPNVTVARSYAVSTNTWLVRAVATSGTPTWQLTVIANCVS